MRSVLIAACAGLTLLLLGAVWVPQARADAISSDLGAAGPGNYGVLFLSTSTGDQINQKGVIGNVGLDGGTLSVSGGSPIDVQGNVWVGNGGSLSNSGAISGSVNISSTSTYAGGGGTFASPNTGVAGLDAALTNANTAALAANTDFTGMTASSGTPTGALTTTQTINGSGLTVVKLSSINLNGTTLTLNGAAGTEFVIDVSGNMNVQSGGAVDLTGGVSNDDVVFDVGANLSTSGPTGTINGIVIDMTGTDQLSNAFINGELIAAGTAHIVSGSTVTQEVSVPAMPEPSTLSLLVTALFGLVGLAAWPKRIHLA